MISKLIKTAKFMAEWLDWTLLYPLWQTKTGREQIIRYGLQFIKKHPEKLKEIQALVEKVMGEEILKAVFAKANPDRPPEVVFVKDASKGDPPPKVPEPPVAPRNGRHSMSDLKTRLGLKKG